MPASSEAQLIGRSSQQRWQCLITRIEYKQGSNREYAAGLIVNRDLCSSKKRFHGPGHNEGEGQHTGTNSVFESKDFGGQLLVDVIALVDPPKVCIACLFKQILEGDKAYNGLLVAHLITQEIQAQVEIWFWQCRQCLDQDVVDNLIVNQVVVELVPIAIITRHIRLTLAIPAKEQ